MKKVKIFRNGNLVVTPYSGEVLDMAQNFDSVRPKHLPARIGSLYASPSIPGVARWIYSLKDYGYDTYELDVDADKVFVFSIETYDRACIGRIEFSAYWDSAMTLSDYLLGDFDDTKYEILLSPSEIIASRRVCRRRILDHLGEGKFDRARIEKVLKNNKIR